MVLPNNIKTTVLRLVLVEEEPNLDAEQISEFVLTVWVVLEQLGHEGGVASVQRDFLLQGGPILHFV